MRITDVIKVDQQFKYHRKAITLAETIQNRLEYHLKNKTKELIPLNIERAEQLLEELKIYHLRLDRDEFISHTLRRPVKDIMDYVFSGCPKPGRAQHDELTQTVVEQMNLIGKDTRANQYRSLLLYEIAYRAHQNWYMIFNTLTVAPGEYKKVFSPTSKAFQDYIRVIDRLIATATYGSIRNAKDKPEYHTYFAVVEEGAKLGRLHIHVIHFIRTLPFNSDDPNKGLTIPSRRELNTFKANWQYGFSSPIMVRYSPKDAFGTAGYRWPYDLRTSKPLVIGTPLKLASYMSKYITKSYSSPKRSEHLWRIRKTQNLGKQILHLLVSPLTRESLLAVATCNSLNLKLNNQRIPPQLIRIAALQRYKDHCTAPHEPTLHELACNIQPRPSLLHASRALTQRSNTYSQQSSGIMKILNLKDEDIFKVAWEELQQSAARINEEYFANANYGFGTTSIRDHIY